MSKHTPGPVKVGASCLDGIRIETTDGKCSLGTIWGIKKESTVEFIVKAMNCHADMLDACIKAHDTLLSLHVCDLDQPHADAMRGTLRTAIAKAKGEA